MEVLDDQPGEPFGGEVLEHGDVAGQDLRTVGLRRDGAVGSQWRMEARPARRRTVRTLRGRVGADVANQRAEGVRDGAVRERTPASSTP